jgi:hypothetical protein
VKPKIEEIFSGLDINIIVYNFNQRWGTRDPSRNSSEDPSRSVRHKNEMKSKRKQNRNSDKLQKQNAQKERKKEQEISDAVLSALCNSDVHFSVCSHFLGICHISSKLIHIC